jgi:hypothetical protein
MNNMSYTLEEFEQYKNSYNAFLAEANPEDDTPTYFDCKANQKLLREAMQKLAAEQGLTWRQLWDVRLWSSIFMQERRHLEPIPPPEPGESQLEAIARRNYELGLKDRSESSFANQRRARMEEIAETPEEALAKAAKNLRNYVDGEKDRIKKMQADADARKDLEDNPENHIGKYLPANYDYSVELSPKEMSDMPKSVFRLYRSRWNEHERQRAEQAYNDKLERIRRKQDAQNNE